MSQQDIEFGKLSGMRVTIKFEGPSDKEVIEHQNRQVTEAEKARAKIIASGEWWHAWEQDPEPLVMASVYGFSPDDVHAAVSVLKQLLPAPWLQKTLVQVIRWCLHYWNLAANSLLGLA